MLPVPHHRRQVQTGVESSTTIYYFYNLMEINVYSRQSGRNRCKGNILSDSDFKDRDGQQRLRFGLATVTVGQHNFAASIRNFTDRGVLFIIDTYLEIGSEIDIAFMVPMQAGIRLNGTVCCHGRVVRSDFFNGQYSVAAEIGGFGTLRQA